MALVEYPTDTIKSVIYVQLTNSLHGQYVVYSMTVIIMIMVIMMIMMRIGSPVKSPVLKSHPFCLYPGEVRPLYRFDHSTGFRDRYRPVGTESSDLGPTQE